MFGFFKSKATWLFLVSLGFSIAAIALTSITLVLAIKSGVGDFYKAAVAPAIALIGSCLATFTSAYVVNQQQASAERLEQVRAEIGEKLEGLKAQSSQQLERLKIQLDSRKIAYHELCGAAAVYIYSLRSSAVNQWNISAIEDAELGMIKASHYLIYVDEDLAGSWTKFWQEAQYIFRTVRLDSSGQPREILLGNEMTRKVADGKEKLDLRDRYERLEKDAKRVLNKS